MCQTVLLLKVPKFLGKYSYTVYSLYVQNEKNQLPSQEVVYFLLLLVIGRKKLLQQIPEYINFPT